MEITVQETKRVLVLHAEAVRIAVNTIEHAYGLSFCFLRDGKVFEELECGEKEREATVDDIAALKVIAKLNDSLR